MRAFCGLELGRDAIPEAVGTISIDGPAERGTDGGSVVNRDHAIRGPA